MEALMQVRDMQTFLFDGLAHAMMRQDTDMLYKYVYCRNLSSEIVDCLMGNLSRWQETARAKGLSARTLSEWLELLVRMSNITHSLLEAVYNARRMLRTSDLSIQDIQKDMQLNSKMLDMQLRLQVQMGAQFYNVAT